MIKDDDLVARDITDRGFPRGQLVLASLRARHLPVISHAFAEDLTAALQSGKTGNSDSDFPLQGLPSAEMQKTHL